MNQEPKAVREQAHMQPGLEGFESMEEVYNLFFEHSPDVQFVLEIKTARFRQINRVFTAVLGYSAQDVEQRALTMMDVVCAEDLPRIQWRSGENLADRDTRYEIRVRTKDGDERHFEVSIRPFRIDGARFLLGSGRDITALKDQTRRAQEAARAVQHHSQALMTLREKLHAMTEITTSLLETPSVSDIMQRAVQGLREVRGFNLEGALVALGEGDRLQLGIEDGTILPFTEICDANHPLLQVYLGRRPYLWQREYCAAPLLAGGEILGVVAMRFYDVEWRILERHAVAREGLLHSLLAVGQTLGLTIANRRLFEEVERNATIDALTGVFNRRYLDLKLEEEFKRASRYDRRLTLMIIDLDEFKPINDRYSHMEGDGILRAVARMFKTNFRELDTITRFGGDEFVIIMPETSIADARAKAESLRVLIERKPFPNQSEAAKPHRISLSIGIAGMDCRPADAKTLLQRADEALYEAKRGGRNCVRVAQTPDTKGKDEG